jgi:hypothetical protein
VKESARSEKVAQWRDSFSPHNLVTESKQAKFMRRACYYILVGNPEEKRLFGKSVSRWVYNIKTDSKGTDYEGFYWFRV